MHMQARKGPYMPGMPSRQQPSAGTLLWLDATNVLMSASAHVCGRMHLGDIACRLMLEQALRMQGQDGTFHAKAAQEMAALRRLQSELEAETGSACFLGLSVASTVQQCLRLGNARAAGRVKGDFRLPDRHFALLKVRCA